MSDQISGFEHAKRLGIKKALAMVVNGVECDLSSQINDGPDSVEIITQEHSLALEIMRHTTAHILAQAISEVYPGVELAIGPNIQDGFYYDVKTNATIVPSDFEKIEDKMRSIIKSDYKIQREVISKPDAIKLFSELKQSLKVSIIEDLDCNEVSIYKHEDKFVDLCRGPHLPKTGMACPHFKIMKVSGSYWRGDANGEKLQRIYATSWFSKEDLETYIKNIEEAEKRDHRKIAKDMDLFHMQDEAVGSIFWHPKGWTLYTTLRSYIGGCAKKDGYLEVSTPQMIDKTLWEASGHWEKFHSNMFIAESENRTLAIKPMNCPGHIQIYKHKTRSYRDLPYRISEFGVCHRNEPSGALYGAMRVRSFIQDDGHIFCMLDQINSETKKFCDLLTRIYKTLGFDTFSVKFSDRPPVRAGDDKVWDLAEELLIKATLEAGFTSYTTNKGEGAFYGPKLEFVLKDKLGRDWQCGTLQVDFILPERLGAWYIAEDGSKQHPILIHRAVLGSLERFIGILLENYAGKLPIWLMPTQIVLATVTNDSSDYAKSAFDLLVNAGIRVELDDRPEKISYKIREHILSKVPVIAVIGKNEVDDKTITFRYGSTQEEQETIALESAVQKMCDLCAIPELC